MTNDTYYPNIDAVLLVTKCWKSIKHTTIKIQLFNEDNTRQNGGKCVYECSYFCGKKSHCTWL